MEETIYYIHIGGVQQGPFTLQQIAAEGISPETMIWRPGLSNWVPASSLPEVMAVLQRPANPYESAYRPQPPYGQPTYPYGNPSQPPYVQPYGGWQTGWTNWLPWAIAATVVAVVFCGLLNTVFGIIGIVKANSANDAMRRGDPAALQINNSAKTWTIVSFVLSGIALVLLITVFAAGIY